MKDVVLGIIVLALIGSLVYQTTFENSESAQTALEVLAGFAVREIFGRWKGGDEDGR